MTILHHDICSVSVRKGKAKHRRKRKCSILSAHREGNNAFCITCRSFKYEGLEYCDYKCIFCLILGCQGDCWLWHGRYLYGQSEQLENREEGERAWIAWHHWGRQGLQGDSRKLQLVLWWGQAAKEFSYCRWRKGIFEVVNPMHEDLGMYFQCCYISFSQSYLCLPPHQSMTEGHCLIVPMYHTTCATQLDEDVWDEMQVSFMTAHLKSIENNHPVMQVMIASVSINCWEYI